MNPKRLFRIPERLVLYSYFLILIGAGTVLLSLPISWSGGSGRSDVPNTPGAPRPHVLLIDAMFTAVSAVCVTGLTTVNTALWSRFGQIVILVLIQAGGLGIVTFGMLYLVMPKARIPLRETQMLRSSFAAGGMMRPRSVIRSIFITTFLIEGIGAAALSIAFARSGRSQPVFSGIFHAVSAFCNAGFSVFNEGLAPYRSDPAVNITLMVLIILGGIGFMVIRDLRGGMSGRGGVPGRRCLLLFHTRLMLTATPLFIAAGLLGYLLLDSTDVFSGLPPAQRILAALFQSVTTRTAGFSTVDQAALSAPSRWLTLMLMIIGGGSGSTAGGIKVSTAFILVLVLFRGVSERGDIRFLGRRITPADVSRAAMFFLKAVALLFLSILALGVIERPDETGFPPSDIIFESVSALGTVGLSTGITERLSRGGKLVVMATMFMGRVGLFSLVMRTVKERAERMIERPKGEVLIG